MTEKYEILRKILKEEMEQNETTKEIPKDQFLGYIIKELARIDYEPFNTQINEYFSKLEDMKEEDNKNRFKYQELIEKYHNAIFKAL